MVQSLVDPSMVLVVKVAMVKEVVYYNIFHLILLAIYWCQNIYNHQHEDSPFVYQSLIQMDVVVVVYFDIYLVKVKQNYIKNKFNQKLLKIIFNL